MNRFMKMIISVFMKESRYNKINIKDKFIKNKRIILISLFTIFLVIIDQLVKFIIASKLYNSTITIFKGILNLTYVQNTGGAFGIGSSSTIMFVILNVIIITIIMKFILSKKGDISISILISLILILAGGIGNLIDRIFRGYVIDYIDINPLIKYPMFNIADICVVLGCMIIFILVIYDTLKSRRAKE